MWLRNQRFLVCAQAVGLLALMVATSTCDDAEEVTLPPVVGELPEPKDGVICQAREWSCTSPTDEAKCGFDGTYVQYAGPCADGEICSAEGPGHCLPKICETGSRRCRTDAIAEVCGPGGDVWVDEVDCGDDYLCSDGRCTLESCLSQVLFVIDRSGSMGSHWNAVRNATKAVIAGNPVARFGAMGFPSPATFCGVPDGPSVPLTTAGLDTKLDTFFGPQPFGRTPLVAVLHEVKARAAEIFGPSGGAVVVLTDGYDTCATESEASSEAMATLATALKSEHNLSTYVIGYEFQGAASVGLRSLAANGGTEYTDYIRAGSEEELTDVFRAIVSDWKLCF